MEARIELELRGKKPSEVVDLLLDNCKATQISGLTEEFDHLTTMSLINVGLTTLNGLPKLESLRTIDLSDNKLSGDLGVLVEKCPRLYHINLCANKIKDIESLAPLKDLVDLAALDLFDCDVTELDGYRQKVFELLPNLKYLDGFDINDIEADMSDEDDDAEDGMGGGEDDEGDVSAEDDDDEVAAEESDEERNGLAYLNSSKALNDKDESEDYVAKNGNGNGNAAAKKTDAEARGTKRKLEAAAPNDQEGAKESGDGEPEPKVAS